MSVLLKNLVEFLDGFGDVLDRFFLELQTCLLLLVESGTAKLSLLFQLGNNTLVLPSNLM